MDSKMTPMIKQYMEIKRKHREEILFFRMGDFYEMFFEDAVTASGILNIALTSRQNDIPMCGIPHHASENYIARLIKAGKRVAICEQLETTPSSGSVVRREVVRIITPGTLVEENLLQTDDNNFLASVIIGSDKIGMAFVDVSTGDFFVKSIKKAMEIFRGEIAKFRPGEIVFRQGELTEDCVFANYLNDGGYSIYRINDWLFDADYMSSLICDTFSTLNTKGLGLTDELDIISAGALIQYLNEMHRQSLRHLKNPKKTTSGDRMLLDDSAISSLEIIHNQQDSTKSRSLFSVLNNTATPMGRRALERNLLEPLLSEEEINSRLDIVQYFHEHRELSETLGTVSREIHDMERIMARFSLGRIFPRNFIAIRNSLAACGKIRNLLQEQTKDFIQKLASGFPEMSNLRRRLEETVEDNPATSPEQGRVIKKGLNAELDRLYSLKSDSRTWMLKYQEDEKKRLGASTLRVKYNKILGYYIEISRGQARNVTDDYIRKQTLVNGERFTTDKLQNFENDILSASEKIISIENSEIEKLTDELKNRRSELAALSAAVAEIDFFNSLAIAARENKFVRPSVNSGKNLHIKNGRHPVVEKYHTKEIFIPNDILLDSKDNIIQIITGPNMAGKSTYIRMAGIIQLMAQAGSFVPASSAEIPLVDRIFTRIGASDNISRGESTFLVEMNETANILNNATDRSLIIMDEVGRGTSTTDGLSIAWAIVEYILSYLRAKTLFATHYHELTALGGEKGIKNYNVLVKEDINGIEFLHRVVPGSADKSYGIHVAKLAGIPEAIIIKSGKIQKQLEKKSASVSKKPDAARGTDVEQLEMFNAANHLLRQALKNIDPDNITPLQALNELKRLKDLIE